MMNSMKRPYMLIKDIDAKDYGAKKVMQISWIGDDHIFLVMVEFIDGSADSCVPFYNHNNDNIFKNIYGNLIGELRFE
jgi:hypothetical protein